MGKLESLLGAIYLRLPQDKLFQSDPTWS